MIRHETVPLLLTMLVLGGKLPRDETVLIETIVMIKLPSHETVRSY